MGAAISKIVGRFFLRPMMRVLMVGLDASGKTTILYKLKLGDIVTTIPTIGFNVETVEYRDINFIVWDIGGQSKIRPLWRHYFLNTQGIIFVVDSNDRDRIAEARNELHRILSDNELDNAALLVFANKQDLPGAMNVSEVAAKLGLHSLSHRRWYIQGTSATSGSGLYEGLDWLRDSIVSVAAGDGNPLPVRREVHGGGRIFDISHRYVPEMPSWGASEDGLGQFLWLRASMKKGSKANRMEVKMPTHTGTHVDAPGHMIDRYFDAGFDVDTLDLEVLNGPAILVDVPRDKNITAEVMESLKIPKGVRRVIFRTSNTDRQLMFKREYDTSYTAFTTDGAKWLVENTDIKLVGVDFLSVATHEHLVPAHLEFLESREIILVEGLKLDSVAPGLYSVHCLPLRLLGAEGSPIRCILIR